MSIAEFFRSLVDLIAIPAQSQFRQLSASLVEIKFASRAIAHNRCVRLIVESVNFTVKITLQLPRIVFRSAWFVSSHPLIGLLILGLLYYLAASVRLNSHSYHDFSEYLYQKCSRFLFQRGVEYHLDPNVVRDSFHSTTYPVKSITSPHTHPESAAARNASARYFQLFANKIGLVPYHLQMSSSDQRHARLGSRMHYWAQDLTADCVDVNIPDDSVVCLTDVDQYVDMERLLARQFKPTLLYTFQPEAVAKVAGDYMYTFDQANKVVYNVDGGNSYNHHVWNYRQDALVVTDAWLWHRTTCVYLVERRTVAPDRELVLLTPVRRWFGIAAYFANSLYSSVRLDYLSPVTQGYSRMMVRLKGKLHISTGEPNSYLQATIEAKDDASLRLIANQTKSSLQMTHTKVPVKGDIPTSAILLAYHRANMKQDHPPFVCPVTDSVANYQYDVKAFDADATPVLRPFMSPLVLNNCFVAQRTLANEVKSVVERVTKTAPPVRYGSDFFYQVVTEYLELLIPMPHLVQLAETDDVYESQSRPGQRRTLDDAQYSNAYGMPKVIMSFLKGEANQKPSPPRNISTVNGVDKLDYSTIMLAFAREVLKHQSWYAFGHTPLEISERVVEVCTHATTIVLTDFSIFDGHGGNLMRDVERLALMRAFPVHLHDWIISVHRTQFCIKGYTTGGYCYDTQYTRASGSPETSAFNSLINSFVAFLALRLDSFGVKDHYTPMTAWSKLGVYGGDDGMTADLLPEKFDRAAKMLDQEVKQNVVNRDMFGIKFLNRVYSTGVWQGDNDSCSDIVRAISKLHVAHALPPRVTKVMKLVEKCRGYAMSDPVTPILGPFATTALRLAGSLVSYPEAHIERTWNSQYELAVQYPNKCVDWMNDYVAEYIEDAQLDVFNNWISGVDSVDAMLSPPVVLFRELDTKVTEPVVINGDVVLPPGSFETNITNTFDSSQHVEESMNRRKQAKPKAKQTPPPPNPEKKFRGKHQEWGTQEIAAFEKSMSMSLPEFEAKLKAIKEFTTVEQQLHNTSIAPKPKPQPKPKPKTVPKAPAKQPSDLVNYSEATPTGVFYTKFTDKKVEKTSNRRGKHKDKTVLPTPTATTLNNEPTQDQTRPVVTTPEAILLANEVTLQQVLTQSEPVIPSLRHPPVEESSSDATSVEDWGTEQSPQFSSDEPELKYLSPKDREIWKSFPNTFEFLKQHRAQTFNKNGTLHTKDKVEHDPLNLYLEGGPIEQVGYFGIEERGPGRGLPTEGGRNAPSSSDRQKRFAGSLRPSKDRKINNQRKHK